MPYEKHPLFTAPKGPGVKLWRYMDFTKLVSLLQKEALFFPSARTLQKIDPWEGTEFKKELDFIIDNIVYMMKNITNEEVTFDKLKEKVKQWELISEDSIDKSFISCWHYNITESAAMWRLYLKSNEGISIQTDIDSFKLSFKDTDYKVYIGIVRYKNYETGISYSGYDKTKIKYPFNNDFLPLVHKRYNYEHEKEYRAIISFPLENNKEPTETEKKQGGIFVPVDLKLLIKKIILAPGSPEWFKELVEETLKTYKLDVEVVRSVVDDEPYKFDLEPYKDLKE
jgi:hypothetical protein